MSGTRVFFFDIDGTLLRAGHGPLSPAVQSALKTLRGRGHKLFLCTGRTKADILPPLAEAGFDGYVAGAGAHVVVEGCELYRHRLPHTTLREVLALAQRHGASGYFEGPGGFWKFEGAVPLPWEMHVVRQQADITPGMEVQKFTFHTQSEQATRAVLPALCEMGFVCYPGASGTFLEMVSAGCTKEAGLARVMAQYGLPADASIAFGDSLNDMGMLSAAGVGVAMGDSPPALADIADMITGTVEQDGVATGLARLGFVPADLLENGKREKNG